MMRPGPPDCIVCGTPTNQRCFWCRRPVHRRYGSKISPCWKAHCEQCPKAPKYLTLVERRIAGIGDVP